MKGLALLCRLFLSLDPACLCFQRTVLESLLPCAPHSPCLQRLHCQNRHLGHPLTTRPRSSSLDLLFRNSTGSPALGKAAHRLGGCAEGSPGLLKAPSKENGQLRAWKAGKWWWLSGKAFCSRRGRASKRDGLWTLRIGGVTGVEFWDAASNSSGPNLSGSVVLASIRLNLFL